MPTIKLTQLAVSRLNPPEPGQRTETGKPIESVTHWDSQLPGFGLRISVKGRRTWTAMYRVNGKAVMESLGTMAQIPKVDVARDLARASMIKARSGVHPVEQKRQHQAAAKAEAAAQQKTFAWLLEHVEEGKGGAQIRKGFLPQYAERNQRPGTLYETKRKLNRMLPYLGQKLLTNIRRTDITEMLDDIAAKRLRVRTGDKGGPDAEARTIQGCLNTVFAWAFREELIDVNPMARVSKTRHGKDTPRDRVLTDDEIRAFWLACDQLGWPYGPIGQLLLLTGQRQAQVGGLLWSELGLQDRVWTLPGERCKNGVVHIVPLSDRVTEIIKALPRIDGDLVFSLTGTTAVNGFSHCKVRLDALMRDHLGTMQPFVWHDLRRTARTLLSKAGVLPHISERVLGHTQPGLERVYDRHQFVDEKRQALEQLASMIERILNPPTDNIVTLRPTA